MATNGNATPPDNLMHFLQEQPPVELPQLQQSLWMLAQQVHHHQSVFSDLQALKHEIMQLRTTNQALADENSALKAQLTNALKHSNTITPPPPVQSIANKNGGQRSFAAVAATTAPQKNIPALARPVPRKKRIAAARIFKSPETRGPQGFEYVYLGRSRKLNRSEVRVHLRKAGADTSRIVDICFPTSGVIGILLHTQYSEEFKEIMQNAEAEIIAHFEPLDPRHLADPKFASHSAADPSQEMATLVHNRCISTLSFIRPLLVASVGKSFVQQGWLAEADVHMAMEEAQSRFMQQNPKKTPSIFKSQPKNEETMDEGEDNTEDTIDPEVGTKRASDTLL